MSGSYPPPARKPLLSDKMYNTLKHVAATGLPAVITLYFLLAQVWNWSNTAQVMATLTGINTFLGVLMGYSTFAYNASDAKYDGEIQVNGAARMAQLVFNGDPVDTLNKRTAVLKVTTPPAIPQTDPAADGQHLLQ